MASKLDYLPIAPLLPLENPSNHEDRFAKSGMAGLLHSLVCKVLLTEQMEVVVHKSFSNALNEATNRGAVRGKDYVIFPKWEDGHWCLEARIDKHFISEEDVINE